MILQQVSLSCLLYLFICVFLDLDAQNNTFHPIAVARNVVFLHLDTRDWGKLRKLVAALTQNYLVPTLAMVN